MYKAFYKISKKCLDIFILAVVKNLTKMSENVGSYT